MASIIFVKGRKSCYEFKGNKLRKKIPDFMLHFWNIHHILNILKKNVTLIAYVFSYQILSKTWLDKCLKSLVLEHPLTVNMRKGPKHSWNVHHSTFIIFLLRLRKLSWMMSLLLISETLGRVVNTMTADKRYSLCNRENLPKSIEMQLSMFCSNLRGIS